MNFDIEKSWKEKLASEFTLPYFAELSKKINEAYLTATPTYPPKEQIFSAFELCPFDKVKVVILGQDPYHGPHQAHGLSFSVPQNIKIPPSLKNIYKEIQANLGKETPLSGNLEPWARQGVLLLNATLTVSGGQPASHQGIGWETFTDAVIKKISKDKEHVVFILWGKYAQAKAAFVDNSKHLILTAPHPSPFSAYTGFFDCKHFSKTNNYLTKTNQSPIIW